MSGSIATFYVIPNDLLKVTAKDFSKTLMNTFHFCFSSNYSGVAKPPHSSLAEFISPIPELNSLYLLYNPAPLYSR